jgi:hypothetical protein
VCLFRHSCPACSKLGMSPHATQAIRNVRPVVESSRKYHDTLAPEVLLLLERMCRALGTFARGLDFESEDFGTATKASDCFEAA